MFSPRPSTSSKSGTPFIKALRPQRSETRIPGLSVLIELIQEFDGGQILSRVLQNAVFRVIGDGLRVFLDGCIRIYFSHSAC